MKKLLLFIPLLSYLFNHTVEIQSGTFQENSYLQSEAVYINVHVKNTGSMTLSDLWLNVDISDPNGTNVIESLWQYLPTLDPNETYETGYDSIWDIPIGVLIGNYYLSAPGVRSQVNTLGHRKDVWREGKRSDSKHTI